MNDPHDYDHGHDQNHDFGDAQLSAIYRQSRVEQPPMKLDSAILSEGRNAVAKKVKWWRTSWIAPIATASVAVLAVTIGMMNKSMVSEHEVIMEQAPEPMMMDLPKETDTIQSLDSAPAKRQPPSTTPPAASGMTAPAPAETIEREMAPAAVRPEMMKQKAAPAPKMELRSREGLVAEPQQFNEEMDLAKPQAADEVPEPEAWLEQIRRLKEAGKNEEATRELEQFSKAYPDYKLPADLVPLEKHPGDPKE